MMSEKIEVIKGHVEEAIRRIAEERKKIKEAAAGA